jgi:hypothetical protein
MLDENIQKVLGIIENGGYTEIKRNFVPIGTIQYDVITYNGGTIRLIHEDKGWFTREYVDVLLFVPNKEYCIFYERYKSNHKLFNRVYEAWKKIRNEYDNNEFENNFRFF